MGTSLRSLHLERLCDDLQVSHSSALQTSLLRVRPEIFPESDIDPADEFEENVELTAASPEKQHTLRSLESEVSGVAWLRSSGLA